MKIHLVEQKTEAWLKLRAGIPTASRAKDLITPTRKVSKATMPYMCELIAESIIGPLETADTPWMQRGTELEPWARSFYEFVESVTVRQVGFITLDDGSFGYSPDALVGDDGTLEIKTPKAPGHVQNILKMTDRHGPQIQAGLMVTERKWCDLISYNPEIPPVIVRVERDEGYISLLRTALEVFVPALAEKRAYVLQQLNWTGETKG